MEKKDGTAGLIFKDRDDATAELAAGDDAASEWREWFADCLKAEFAGGAVGDEIWRAVYDALDRRDAKLQRTIATLEGKIETLTELVRKSARR